MLKRIGLYCLSITMLVLVGCGEEKAPKVGTEAAKAGTDVAKEVQQTFNWRLVTTWPKNFPGLGSAPENFAKAVTKMSGGRLTVKVYGANELVPAMAVFDSVARGAAEMGHGAAYYWKGKTPAAQFFTAVPFGLNAQEMNAWLSYGGGIELWRDLYDEFNLIPFVGGSTGVQMAGWFNKEINSVADLKGLKMRIPGLAGEVLQRLGGIPVTLPGGEIFTALQTGSIDATEWVGPYNDLTFGLHKAAKYYYYPGWHEPGAMLEFIVNKDAWNTLPEDLQAIVTHATKSMNQDMLNEYTARNNLALKELVETHGIILKKLPDEVLRALKQASAEVVAEVVANDPKARVVYDSFKAFSDNVIPYTLISEKAFIEAREK
ncbi:MAG: ABC transporter substrate-binding protein [Moraxellaceae bacterium]|nr:MAG: ABC transporter substrate-binding protein [Moraxellaceae bacterium]